MKEKARAVVVTLAFLGAACLVSVACRFAREEMTVDRCLSGRHGSFNYSSMTCDLEENHPYIAYHVRHPRDKRNAEISLAWLVTFASAYSLTKTRIKTP